LNDGNDNKNNPHNEGLRTEEDMTKDYSTKNSTINIDDDNRNENGYGLSKGWPWRDSDDKGPLEQDKNSTINQDKTSVINTDTSADLNSSIIPESQGRL